MKRKLIAGIILSFSLSVLLVGCDWLEDDEYYSADGEVVEETVESTAESTNETIAENTVETTAETEADDSYPVGYGASIDFTTVDINGNAFSTDMLQGARVVMLNLWEPWCGPCVGEMPELNELYETYKDQGLLIIGAYSSFDMDADAREIVEVYDISYPIIKCNSSINTIEQDYVPATFLLDRNGNLITDEPFAGSDSYSGWEAVISPYLE